MAVYNKLLLLFALLLLCSECSAGDEALPGHMQPLGSHMEPELVRRIDHMPSPSEFYENFVRPKIPVVLEGLMSGQEVLSNWQSDDYLRRVHGESMMSVEYGKKENRSEPGFSITVDEFLRRYQDENIYMVSDLSEEMRKEWVLPRFLLCGGYTEELMFMYLWFSSGGTKSVVHTDSYENLHCLVSGRKRFVLIEPRFSESIGPEHKATGFFNIDVESVDMTVYPNLANTPWHLATVQPGDCLYLPYQWLHNVNSEGRNMGVNLWWNAFKYDPAECPDDLSDLPQFQSLDSFSLSPELQLKEVLVMAAKEDGRVMAEDVFDLVSQHFELADMKVEYIQDMFDILLPDCKGVIPSVDMVTKDRVRAAFEFFTTLADELSRRQAERSFHDQEQPFSEDEYYQELGEFGGEEEDLWEGPISEREKEEGGGRHDNNRDEL